MSDIANNSKKYSDRRGGYTFGENYTHSFKRKKFVWNEEIYKKIISLSKRGCNYAQICRLLNINKEEFFKRKKQDAELRSAIEKGKAIGISKAEGVLYKEAIKGKNYKFMSLYLTVMGVVGKDKDDDDGENNLKVISSDGKNSDIITG